MYVYIAAPFFNSTQLEIVCQIEELLDGLPGISFYSPRLHSGSHLLTAEQKRTYHAWTPVLQSNIYEIDRTDLMLAVVEFAMPHGMKLAAARPLINDEGRLYGWNVPALANPVELPDNGVVFECGYAKARDIPIVGYHSTKQLSEMNLMLSHTMEGFITGFANLCGFFAYNGRPCINPVDALAWTYAQQYEGAVI